MFIRGLRDGECLVAPPRRSSSRADKPACDYSLNGRNLAHRIEVWGKFVKRRSQSTRSMGQKPLQNRKLSFLGAGRTVAFERDRPTGKGRMQGLES